METPRDSLPVLRIEAPFSPEGLISIEQHFEPFPLSDIEMSHGEMLGIFKKAEEPIFWGQKSRGRQALDIHPPFLGLPIKSTLKQPVHRVSKPNLLNLLSVKRLKKIIFKVNILKAVSLRLQSLLVCLHGGSMEHQFLLVELERRLNS